MKKKSIQYIIAIISIQIIFSSILINLIGLEQEPQNDNTIDIKIKISDFWPNLSPIYINNNWSYTAGNESWCYLEGNIYIIENAIINANGVGSGITIENSEDYFKIRNCTIFNAGGSTNDAGIFLNNTRHGILENNNLSNSYRGLNIRYCSNISIYDNQINDNSGFGINLYRSSNNTLKNNMANDNYYYGLFIQTYSNNNTVFNNDFNDNDINGICITSISSDNRIISNHLEGNDYGINIQNIADVNVIEWNIIINNNIYGVYISTNNYVQFPENNFFSKNWFNNPSGINAYDNGSNTYWDVDGLGNYWSDYNGIDSNSDCIGDTPYSITSYYSGIKDDFPLMACWFSTKSGGGIPGYDVLFIIGIIGVISIPLVLVFKRRIKLS